MIGWFDDRWTLREALRAMQARRRDEWDRLSWGLLWIVNRMPNFSKTARPPVRLDQLNPYLRREARPMSDDAIERALDNMAKRSNR